MTMDLSSTFAGNRRGTRAEFDELVHRCHRQAYNIAYRLAGNSADAEDLTQEAFLRAYRFFDRYNRSMPFENWMYRIISNVFVDELRRRPKFNTQSLDQPLPGLGADSEVRLEIPDSAHDPAANLMFTALDAPVQQSLDALPAEFRQSVILADIEGMSYEEIADAMGCSIGTVRSRLHRGRKLLRNRLLACGIRA